MEKKLEMGMAENLKNKLKNKTARVGVVGLGYVGLPLALEFAEAGFQVVGLDVDDAKVKSLLEGRSHIEDISDARLKAQITSKRFVPVSSYSDLGGVDTISVCVPTPLRKTKDPDLSYILASLEGLLPQLRAGQLIVLESTTYPGTTRELFAPPLEEKGFKIGQDIFVAFSPERVDPGNQKFNTKNTPKVIGGLSSTCTEMATTLYQNAVETVVPVGSAEEAEMVKLLENTFRAVNIALVNEMLLMCDRMEIDIWNVVKAASTKPFGFMPFYPGPGIGGHCIPLDPAYLSWKAKTFNFYNRFIELASDVNSNMPRFVVSKAVRVLNDLKKSMNGSKILVAGVAYKPNVSDTRESPALEIIRLMQESGAEVRFFDTHVRSLEKEGIRCEFSDLSQASKNEFDLAVLVTHHTNFKKDQLVHSCSRVLDCRNFFSDWLEEGSEQIIRL